MNTIKGPAIFLAQFLRDREPYNNIDNISKWVAGLGYKGVQVPSWDSRVLDLEKASESKNYCEEYTGKLSEKGIEVVELAAYLQGQVMAIHPSYETMFQSFYPVGLNDKDRVIWATTQLKRVIRASSNMGLHNVSALSGGLAWHTMYPWPQRPPGLIEEAFSELVRRWLPVLNYAKEHGITIGYELHPGSDLFDGATYEMFLETSGQHTAACITYDPSHLILQQLDYLEFIELYHSKIKAFHVKDAEFNPSGRVGVYGGYQSWVNRAGRFRSLGDGQVNFKRIFSMLTQYGYTGWAILEWESCLKCSEQSARESALFIKNHIIETTDIAFDDFVKTDVDRQKIRKILGLENE